MVKNGKLQDIERKVFTSYHGDGLLDICIGSVLLYLVFITVWFPEYWYFLIVGVIAWISIYAGVKKTITIPRLGYVEFSSIRRRRIQYIVITGLLLLVSFNFLGILAMFYPVIGIIIFESAFTILIVGIIGAFMFALFGAMLDLQRFYAYGVVLLCSAIFTFFELVIVLFPLIVTGIVILAYGFFLLYQFLQQYPKDSGGEVTGA